jgi:hypothetical protein
MIHIRTAAKAFDAAGEHIGPGEWLHVVWEANRVRADTFGTPDSTGPWWAGGGVEEYAVARIIHRDDDSVSIVGKTALGDWVLKTAADRLGIHAAGTAGAEVICGPSRSWTITTDHRVRWYVYGTPGDVATMIPRERSMRGQWGYDVRCSCGQETRTGGATERHIRDRVRMHVHYGAKL